MILDIEFKWKEHKKVLKFLSIVKPEILKKIGKNYRVATLSTFYLTVSVIIIMSLKVIGQF